MLSSCSLGSDPHSPLSPPICINTVHYRYLIVTQYKQFGRPSYDPRTRNVHVNTWEIYIPKLIIQRSPGR